ncbi:preprotein translocase subunit YajC [Aerococcus sp. HMSC072A12]|uniref:Preprotein translocase subunit YajC n=2 Tax=Aerococcaceae TaxID=186827 RepID=A0A5N1GR07_9LACT|nr:preprotein translocase subunit YajC [Aerococcus sanguinicola]OFK21126.1 preprotein translocase subunit YajC [Aerococcus sp. HMSC072A12]OFR32040.1 preprotein translocase subunit YajC [Aerococcus sp. HMSC061A03]OFT42876.1 preprotein translocase subunit YajC [Aerococcus sp. HMSC06H08]
MSLLLYFIVFGGIMYFLMIRPQKKRQEKHRDMLSSMGVGDHAVTIGGLHGIIDEIDEVKNTITLDCEGVLLVFERSSIARTQKADPAGTAAANAAISNAAEAQANEEQAPSQEADQVEEKDGLEVREGQADPQDED